MPSKFSYVLFWLALSFVTFNCIRLLYQNAYKVPVRLSKFNASQNTTKEVIRFKDMELKQSLEFKVHGLSRTCKTYFSSSLKENLNLLLRMKTDKITENYLYDLGFPHRTKKVEDLEIPGYVRRTIKSNIPTIVCAASSNHFAELQALFLHIDTKIRRYFPNIQVVFYDIGLNEQERNLILNYGKVKMRRFDFNRFPPHFRILHLCSWKPVIIQELLREVGFVMYMDTSLRPNPSQLKEYFTLSESTGHLFRAHPATPKYPFTIPTNTFFGTFEYFMVPPCLFHDIPEIESGYMILRSNNIISLLIMRSWLTCALQERCIMPLGAENRTACSQSNMDYHNCHREDQSALGIPVLLIYHQTNNIPLLPWSSFVTKRGESSKYLLNNVSRSKMKLIKTNKRT
ncbi:hypothetical protein LOTGIDRAFT_157486 [Lottia gigantea]|uniref:Uncharacterized protein n=1 Tax=Lottia gigantea TaxID=225164 RepID=V4AVE1_LOTGI|nr:hypothetical protein LOTGIDRAFT_157486 [Lottia gigantea]ESP01308.1 hypothetical protein LOTGIDRAFT_157486 [Lottia gigantea]